LEKYGKSNKNQLGNILQWNKYKREGKFYFIKSYREG
jgi:hypothetical protein